MVNNYHSQIPVGRIPIRTGTHPLPEFGPYNGTTCRCQDGYPLRHPDIMPAMPIVAGLAVNTSPGRRIACQSTVTIQPNKHSVFRLRGVIMVNRGMHRILLLCRRYIRTHFQKGLLRQKPVHTNHQKYQNICHGLISFITVSKMERPVSSCLSVITRGIKCRNTFP